jgi:hypothetical protein
VFVALPSASNAQFNSRLRKLSAEEIEKRGTELAAQIEYAHLHQDEFPALYPNGTLPSSNPNYKFSPDGYDTASIVTRFIPVGTSFEDAEAILTAATLKHSRTYSSDVMKSKIEDIKYSAEIKTYAVAVKHWICDGCLMNSDQITILLETEKTDDFNYVFKVSSTNRTKK